MSIPRVVMDAIRRSRQRKEAQIQAVAGRVAAHFQRLSSLVSGALFGADQATLSRQLSSLLRDLNLAAQDMARRIKQEYDGETLAAVQIAAEGVNETMIAAGIQIMAPDVTLPLLQHLADFTADKITNLSAATISEISTELRLAAMGARPVFDAITNVTDKLKTAGAGKAGFGSLSARGEAIVRTELGRLHSMTTQARLEQSLAQIPDLMKEWRHSGNRLHPRDGHVAMHGVRIPVKERFMVAPTLGGRREPMLHPRDPLASARNVVRCRCDIVAYLARWDE